MPASRRTLTFLTVGWLLATCGVGACQPAKPAPTQDPVRNATVDLSTRPSGSPPSSSPPNAMPNNAADAQAEESGPIAEGATAWRGMVVPTKGGFQVRGVTVEHNAFTQLLAASSLDGVPADPDWYLGAIVRVRGVVVRHVDEPSPQEAELHAQRRAGSWLGASRLESVELVKHAEQVEGVLHRSKGFFSVDKVLVGHQDVGWALVGAQEGDRVKLWGQLHVQVCDPRAQCLLGGSLPIFQVGRGKKLP